MLVKIKSNDGDCWVNPEDVVFVGVKTAHANPQARRRGEDPITKLGVYVRTIGAKVLTFKYLGDALIEMDAVAERINNALKESK